MLVFNYELNAFRVCQIDRLTKFSGFVIDVMREIPDRLRLWDEMIKTKEVSISRILDGRIKVAMKPVKGRKGLDYVRVLQNYNQIMQRLGNVSVGGRATFFEIKMATFQYHFNLRMAPLGHNQVLMADRGNRKLKYTELTGLFRQSEKLLVAKTLDYIIGVYEGEIRGPPESIQTEKEQELAARAFDLLILGAVCEAAPPNEKNRQNIIGRYDEGVKRRVSAGKTLQQAKNETAEDLQGWLTETGKKSGRTPGSDVMFLCALKQMKQLAISSPLRNPDYQKVLEENFPQARKGGTDLGRREVVNYVPGSKKLKCADVEETVDGAVLGGGNLDRGKRSLCSLQDASVVDKGVKVPDREISVSGESTCKLLHRSFTNVNNANDPGTSDSCEQPLRDHSLAVIFRMTPFVVSADCSARTEARPVVSSSECATRCCSDNGKSFGFSKGVCVLSGSPMCSASSGASRKVWMKLCGYALLIGARRFWVLQQGKIGAVNFSRNLSHYERAFCISGASLSRCIHSVQLVYSDVA